MQYRRFGKTGLKVSELALGGGMFQSRDPKDVDEACAIVKRSLELGINYIEMER